MRACGSRTHHSRAARAHTARATLLRRTARKITACCADLFCACRLVSMPESKKRPPEPLVSPTAGFKTLFKGASIPFEANSLQMNSPFVQRAADPALSVSQTKVRRASASLNATRVSVKTYCTHVAASGLLSEIGCVCIYDCMILLHCTREKLENLLECATDKDEELAALVEMQSIIQGAFSSWLKPAIRWRLWIGKLKCNSEATTTTGAAGASGISAAADGLTPHSTVSSAHHRPCTE